MVGLEIQFRIAEEKHQEFYQLVGSLLKQDLAEGCLMRRVFEELGDPGRFVWLEHWTEQPKLDHHLKSDEHRTLMGAVNVLGSLDGIRLTEYLPHSQQDGMQAPERHGAHGGGAP